MCAICGIFTIDAGPVDASRVTRMTEAMAMRGPDASGEKFGPGFGLGHRRLAVIDLSDAGRQPMTNEDGSLDTVLNGEIYNFQELRAELERAGHRFRSRSDTEVLLHGYEEWGIERLLKRARGMFAFALVDHRRRTIHLARDPLGKKPLFFRWANGELLFASSARALALALPSTPAIRAAAIDDLLWNLYIPGPDTIFDGVEKLPPGHYLSIDDRGTRTQAAYWRPDFFHPEHGVDREAWVDRIEAALETAVRRRLIADVPLGILLSGGVDSGLVTAMAARTGGNVKTYSVAADDQSLDESRFASATARHYGTDHHVLHVHGDVRRQLPQLIATFGEPLADASALNVVGISALARESVTVVLTGDGGDEGFGGYSKFWAYYHAWRLQQHLPEGAMRPLARLASGAPVRPIRRAGTLLRLASAPVQETFAPPTWISHADRLDLYTEGMREALGDHCPTAHVRPALVNGRQATLPDRVMQAHMLTILPDDYLAKVDAGTMAIGLEARSPFLDQDLIELAMRIPVRERFEEGVPKALLRRLARRHLPSEVIDRRKQGFVAPVGQWLRTTWLDLVQSVVLGPELERRGWFKRRTVQRLVDEHRTGTDHGYLLWTLLSLELWLRMAVDRTLDAHADLSRP